MNGDELAAEMASAVNSGINPDEFQNHLQNEHPYLQSEVVSQVLVPAISS